jgi:16S rRNA (cytidine1402-2'-O)-methyltransferase
VATGTPGEARVAGEAVAPGEAAQAGDGGRGRLYVVATPIGNLGDITARALETLGAVSLVAAEDTRRTGLLLRHFGIATPRVSYHAHNRRARLPRLLDALTRGDVALVTDAGTPGVSDPGAELVAAAVAQGHEVLAVPGPSAAVAAVSVSGLPAAPFHVVGFLPRRGPQRRRALQGMDDWPGCIVLFEAPHRLRPALADLAAVWGERRVAICCELTKRFESVLHTTLNGAAAHFAEVTPRGEFTLVVEGRPGPGWGGERNAAGGREAGEGEGEGVGEGGAGGNLEGRFAALAAELGDRRKALTALAVETGLPRKALYARLMTRPASPS